MSNDEILSTIERMERNANTHENNGEVNTAIQLRHWAEQLRQAVNVDIRRNNE